MLQLGAKLLEAIVDSVKQLKEPTHILILTLWLSGLGMIAFLVSGCGTLNYQPNETTITNKPTEQTNETERTQP